VFFCQTLFYHFLKMQTMKKNLVAFLALSFLAFGCAKTDNDTITVAAIAVPNSSIDYSALIVGKWKLVEMGYIRSTPDNPSNANSNGCGSNSNSSNSSQDMDWRSASSTEMLAFQSNGDFIKNLQNDGVCKGSYKIVSNFVNTTSDCVEGSVSLPITNINKSLLILENTEGGEKVQMRYEKQ
jgi:hypothetical protein